MDGRNGRPVGQALQMALRILGEDRTWHPLQGDVHTIREVLETLRQVSEARTGGRQVRGVDLRQVTQADHFGTGTSTDDDGFHLMRCEVLAFVDQDQALLETASANSIVSIVPTPKCCDSTVPNQHYPLQNIINP